jgi:hypothetical protein
MKGKEIIIQAVREEMPEREQMRTQILREVSASEVRRSHSRFMWSGAPAVAALVLVVCGAIFGGVLLSQYNDANPSLEAGCRTETSLNEESNAENREPPALRDCECPQAAAALSSWPFGRPPFCPEGGDCWDWLNEETHEYSGCSFVRGWDEDGNYIGASHCEFTCRCFDVRDVFLPPEPFLCQSCPPENGENYVYYELKNCEHKDVCEQCCNCCWRCSTELTDENSCPWTGRTCTDCSGCASCSTPVNITSHETFMATAKNYVAWWYLPYDNGMYSDTAWHVSDMAHLEKFADFFYSLGADTRVRQHITMSPSRYNSYDSFRLSVQGEGWSGAGFLIYTEGGAPFIEFQGYIAEFGSVQCRDEEGNEIERTFREQISGTHRLTWEQYEWFRGWVMPVIDNRTDYTSDVRNSGRQ